MSGTTRRTLVIAWCSEKVPNLERQGALRSARSDDRAPSTERIGDACDARTRAHHALRTAEGAYEAAHPKPCAGAGAEAHAAWARGRERACWRAQIDLEDARATHRHLIDARHRESEDVSAGVLLGAMALVFVVWLASTAA